MEKIWNREMKILEIVNIIKYITEIILQEKEIDEQKLKNLISGLKEIATKEEEILFSRDKKILLHRINAAIEKEAFDYISYLIEF